MLTEDMHGENGIGKDVQSFIAKIIKKQGKGHIRWNRAQKTTPAGFDATTAIWKMLVVNLNALPP